MLHAINLPVRRHQTLLVPFRKLRRPPNLHPNRRRFRHFPRHLFAIHHHRWHYRLQNLFANFLAPFFDRIPLVIFTMALNLRRRLIPRIAHLDFRIRAIMILNIRILEQAPHRPLATRRRQVPPSIITIPLFQSLPRSICLANTRRRQLFPVNIYITPEIIFRQLHPFLERLQNPIINQRRRPRIRLSLHRHDICRHVRPQLRQGHIIISLRQHRSHRPEHPRQYRLLPENIRNPLQLRLDRHNIIQLCIFIQLRRHQLQPPVLVRHRNILPALNPEQDHHRPDRHARHYDTNKQYHIAHPLRLNHLRLHLRHEINLISRTNRRRNHAPVFRNRPLRQLRIFFLQLLPDFL